MKRFILALALIAGAPLQAQTLDSTRTDSVAVWSRTQSSWFTTTDTVPSKPDTVLVPGPLPAGVDTVKFGTDSMTLVFWSTGRINDSSRTVLPPVVALPGLWGPSGYFNATSSGPFTAAPNESSNKAAYVLNNIAEARSRNVPVQLAMPCGSHSPPDRLGNCLDANGVFSFARFDSSMRAIATPEVRAAVVQGYKDGYVLGLLLIDEPWVKGQDDGSGVVVGNSWGPSGTITRAVADRICTLAHSLYPGVPAGMSDHTSWNWSGSLKVCDFTQPQYSHRFGPITAWRDTMLAKSARDGHQTTFSFNWINGGTQDRDGTWDCKDQGGVKGQYTPNCQMTPAQIIEAITVLGDRTCGGLMSWRYDAIRFSSTAYVAAIKQGLALQAKRTRRPCVAR